MLMDLTQKIWHPTWIEIDLNQFRKNIQIIKKKLGKTLYCLPVKANAYGHGLIPIAKVAQEEKIDYLAVSSLSEGIKLREEGITIPILVLGPFHDEQILSLIDYDLEFVISSLYKAKQVISSNLPKLAKVHLEVDTGMHRTGAKLNTAQEIYSYLKSHSKFLLKGVFTHFACAFDKVHPSNEKQIQLFDQFLSRIDTTNLLTHIANSDAHVNFDLAKYKMVRLGLLSFGLMDKKLPPPFNQIKSFFSLKSLVSYFKAVEKDSKISYGHNYITKSLSRIVTVPIGYGDGYKRCLSQNGEVLIREKKHPIAGTICMDQLMVDIGLNDAYIKDEVVLIGQQGNLEITVQDIALKCDTIPYEIVCSFNERVVRKYP